MLEFLPRGEGAGGAETAAACGGSTAAVGSQPVPARGKTLFTPGRDCGGGTPKTNAKGKSRTILPLKLKGEKRKIHSSVL